MPKVTNHTSNNLVTVSYPVREDVLDFYKFCASRVNYDPVDGLFTWKKKNGSDKNNGTWNTKYSNKEICAVNSYGYIRANLKYMGKPKAIFLHRLAWFMYYNEIPEKHIDHINRIRTDNSITNLRVVTNAENCKNRGKSSANTSGVTGVTWNKHKQRWEARCGLDGKKISLGYFKDISIAEEAVKAFRMLNGFSEFHGKD